MSEEDKMEVWELKQLQGLPLEVKILKTKQRIIEWYQHFNGQVYYSFSGGKDSTVLRHLILSLFPDVPGVFVNTGNEYPETVRFVRKQSNIIWLRPKMKLKEVYEKYGYPVGNKKLAYDIYKLRHHNLTDEYRNYLLHGDSRGSAGTIPKWSHCLLTAPFEVHNICCEKIKKNPLKVYCKETGRVPITGETADESKTRRDAYLAHGCNAYDEAIPKSTPLGFWTEQDILEYLYRNNVEICSLYGDIIKGRDGQYMLTGLPRLGCCSCLFGVHLEGYPNRFQQMEKSHPKLHWHCMKHLGVEKVLIYLRIPYRCYSKKFIGVKCKAGEQIKMII